MTNSPLTLPIDPWRLTPEGGVIHPGERLAVVADGHPRYEGGAGGGGRRPPRLRGGGGPGGGLRPRPLAGRDAREARPAARPRGDRPARRGGGPGRVAPLLPADRRRRRLAEAMAGRSRRRARRA